MKGKRFLSLLLCLVMVLGMLPSLVIPASAASTTRVDFWIVEGKSSSSYRIRKSGVTVGGEIPFPTQAELKEKQPGYFGVMKVVDWYTEEPEKKKGVWVFNEDTKVTGDDTIEKNMELWAKTAPQDGQTISISLKGCKPVTITEWNGSAIAAKEELLFDVENKTNVSASTENREKSIIKLPLGTALGETDLNKIPSEWTIDGTKYTINSWATVSQILQVGTVFRAQDKISKYNSTTSTYDPIEVYAQMTWPITINFETNITGKTLPAISLNTATKLNGYAAATTNTMTDTQKAQVADVNTWVQQQENTDGFGRIFRGWYANSRFTGDPFRDGTGYSISGTQAGTDENNKYHVNTPFPGNMTLYARWEDRCKVTFNMGGENLSNAASFTDYYVAVNEKLTAPAVEPQSTNYPNRVFLGWYEDAAWNTAWNFTNKTVTEDVTLYAKWGNAKNVTLNFIYYAPDNDVTPLTKTTMNVPVIEGYPFGDNVPELPGTRTEGDWDPSISGRPISYRTMGTTRGLIYTGWSYTGKYGPTSLTKETVLFEDVDTGGVVTVVAQADVYVQFTFDPQGGTLNGSTNSMTVTRDTRKVEGEPEEPVKYNDNQEQIRFLGWYTEPDGKGKKLDVNEEYSLNTTFYAAWEKEKECTLIFDISKYPGATVVLKKGDEVCSGTTADGKVTYTKLPRGTYQYSITLAGYKPLTGTYEITDATSEEEAYTIEVKDWPVFVPVTRIALNIPDSKIMQKKSYDLSSLATVAPENTSNKTIAWTVSGNDGVTLGKDGKTLTVSADATGSVTLTATITDGKLNDAGTALENYTQSFTLTIVTFRPTITFKNGSGEGPSIDVIQNMPAPVLAVNGKITAPATKPTADGWEFEAWYLDAAYNTAWTADHVFTQDSELFAKWKKEAVPITVTFSDGGSQTKTETHNAGESLVLPPNMFTKAGYIFAAWELPDETTMYAGTTIKALPSTDVTYKATWKEINAAITADDVRHSLDAITAENAKDHKPQLVAARDALAAGTATKTDAELIGSLSELFKSAGLGPVSISGTASQGVTETGAILSSDGAAVVLNVNKLTTPGKTLPEVYQNEEYKSVWYTVSMSVGGATTEPKVPVILTAPIPADLSTMAADTIRVLLYKSAANEPVLMTPTVADSKLTFAFDGNGQIAFVGKEISDTADTRVTGLTMEYNGTKMGNVTQDKDGNFTVVLPASLNQSAIDLLASGKWKTYLTVAPQAKVATAESKEGFDATYWAETGVALTYSLTKANDYSDSRTLTAIAKNGTTRNFTVTVKKITDADRTYKIAVANISGGTVTATPNPAAAGEEVKLTVTPNDGKKLVAGSLSYCLQSAGAKSVPIDESSLTFIMPAGDININAQFEDDANAPLKNPPQITAFVVNGVSAVINSDTKAITIILPYGTDLRHVAPTIVTANASKVEPSSAQRVDLSTPKAYRVYASNGAYVTYTVTAYTEEPSPTQSLWEKLQNQINSNPNWWELAEYQKKTGYYR